MKWKESKFAVLYLRVSTEEQAHNNYSLETQERVCRQLCDERGWQVVEIFRDAGFSGWQDIERPAFRQMQNYIRQNRNVNLVFYDYSRFGRKTLPALKAFEELDKLGILSIAADNPTIDCRGAAGRKARRDELSMAEDFSDKNSEKTSARMRAAFQDGRWTRSAPLGYMNVRTKVRGEPNIVPDHTAPLVKKAFELVAAGHNTTAEVLRTLTDMGLRSSKGNKLTLHSFFKLLRNPVYAGSLQSRKWRETRKGLHQPIVSEQLFRNVQLILSGKKPIVAPYIRNNPDFSLRRFLRCSECGTPLTGAHAKKRYAYYWCYKCKAVKSTPVAEVEEQFLEVLSRLRPNARMLSEFPAILEQEWKSRTTDNRAVVRKLTAQLQEARSMQERLIVAYLRNDKHVLPIYEQMSRKFEEDIALLESQIAEAETENATFEQLLEFSRNLLVDICSAWQHANVDQRQRVQNSLFPNGLAFHPEKGILNSDKDCLFNRLEGFVGGRVSLARPERFELPT